eukprot:104521-Hanusia_phi.AAC.3
MLVFTYTAKLNHHAHIPYSAIYRIEARTLLVAAFLSGLFSVSYSLPAWAAAAGSGALLLICALTHMVNGRKASSLYQQGTGSYYFSNLQVWSLRPCNGPDVDATRLRTMINGLPPRG